MIPLAEWESTPSVNRRSFVRGEENKGSFVGERVYERVVE